jgi:hypothetical protein
MHDFGDSRFSRIAIITSSGLGEHHNSVTSTMYLKLFDAESPSGIAHPRLIAEAREEITDASSTSSVEKHLAFFPHCS